MPVQKTVGKLSVISMKARGIVCSGRKYLHQCNRKLTSQTFATKSTFRPTLLLKIMLPITLLSIGYYYLNQNDSATHTKVKGPLHIRLYTSLPLRYISQCWGYVNDLKLPVMIRVPIYKTYSYLFDCKLDEAEVEDISAFENLGEFFYRKIKMENRSIDKSCDIVCPCDGRLLHCGEITNDEIEQIKGVTYSLNALLGPNPDTELTIIPTEHPTYTPKFGNKLFFAVIYLAPGDYHRFHAPTEFSVSLLRHFAGEMFSVSPRVVSVIQHLFSLNERVCLLGDWKHGLFAMVPVAATNVGKIILNFAPNLLTNVPNNKLDRPLGTAIEEKTYAEGGRTLSFGRGVELGGFKLGSSIVLVFEAPSFDFDVQSGQKVKLGQSIGSAIPSTQSQRNSWRIFPPYQK